MKKIIVLSNLLVVLFVMVSVCAPVLADVPRITIQELKEMMDKGKPDVVTFTVSPGDLASLVGQAADRGIHVATETPSGSWASMRVT